MAYMFTRTIITYKAKAFKVAWKDGKPVAHMLGEAEFSTGEVNKTAARKALKAAGVDCPRGTEIQIEEVSRKKYGISSDEFFAIAHEIDED